MDDVARSKEKRRPWTGGDADQIIGFAANSDGLRGRWRMLRHSVGPISGQELIVAGPPRQASHAGQALVGRRRPR